MQWKLTDGTIDLPESPKQRARFIADVFASGGQIAGREEKVSWKDAAKLLNPGKYNDTIGAPDIHPLLASSMALLIREPVEPMLVITGLYNRVQSTGLHTRVLAGAMGAVTAADVPEHGTYPEVMFQIGGAMQTAHIGKSGIAASFTDEALRYSTWDIMALNLRLMGQALARHKEQKAVSFLRTLGTELFNNSSPTTSMFGVNTGRGLDGAANGSMTMDDLFKGLAHMAEEGFPADVLLMNPLFFYLFIQDPVLRNMMLAHGGGTYFQQFNGNPGPLDPWSNGPTGAMGPSLGNKINQPGNAGGNTATGVAGREHGMTASPPVPAPYFPWNFRIVVSPFVPFDPETSLGDIYLLSSGQVGFYLVDEDPTQVDWRTEDIEVVKVKIRERYGFAVAHEGQGVGVMKNVKLTRNYWDGTITFQSMDIDSEISPTASIDLG